MIRQKYIYIIKRNRQHTQGGHFPEKNTKGPPACVKYIAENNLLYLLPTGFFVCLFVFSCALFFVSVKLLNKIIVVG